MVSWSIPLFLPFGVYIFLKIIIMIYKFNTKKENAFIEVKKDGNTAKITLIDNGENVVIQISKETLYDFIGCLHSIQTKIKKENFNELSNTF